MPWFTPSVKKSHQTSCSDSHEDGLSSNLPPPPNSAARKIKEQSWLNSIKSKPSSASPSAFYHPSSNINNPPNFTSNALGVADSPIRNPVHQASNPSSTLPFLRSKNSRNPRGGGSSRRPMTANSAHDELYINPNPKIATLNQKNLTHHNTIFSRADSKPASVHLSSDLTSPDPTTDEFGLTHESVRSLSGSSSPRQKWQPTSLVSEHHQLPIFAHQAPSPAPAVHDIEVITQSLAIRLQELATANQDGLLNDEEYRILRQALFDRMTATSNEPSVLELGPTPHEIFPNPHLAPIDTMALDERHCPTPPPPAPSSILSTLSPKKTTMSLRDRSLRSTKSSASFIHSIIRNSRWSRNKSAAPSTAGTDDMVLDSPDLSYSSVMGSEPVPQLTRPLHHRPEFNTHTPTQVSSPSSSSQMGYSTSIASSVGPSSDTSCSQSRPPPSLSTRNSSTYSKTSRMMQASPTTIHATVDQPVVTATAMRREISDLEYERGRVLETFDEMERAVMVRGGGQEILAGADDESRTETLRSRPVSFLAPLPSAATLGGSARNRRSKVSSQPPEMETIMSPVRMEGGEIENEELLKELTEIKDRRKAVEDRYGARLEYLNAKLKGAMIRERSKAR